MCDVCVCAFTWSRSFSTSSSCTAMVSMRLRYISQSFCRVEHFSSRSSFSSRYCTHTQRHKSTVRQQTADTGRETQQAKKDQPDYTERGLRGGFLQRSHGASVCVSRVCCCKPHLFSGPLCFIFTHSKTDGNKQPDRQKATCLTPTYLISNVYLCMCVCGCNLVS